VRSKAVPDELAALETDVLAGFVLARAAAGLADATICGVVFRPGHQVSSCLGVSAVRGFVSLPLAVCAVPGCPGQCLYQVGQDLAICVHDAAVFCPYPGDAVGVAEGEDLPRGPAPPFVVRATAAESKERGRRAAGSAALAAPPSRPRARAGRDRDQRPVTGADRGRRAAAAGRGWSGTPGPPPQ
jgi:hypothetical protein